MRWVHAAGDAFIYLREHPEQTVLVHLARAAHDPLTLPAQALPGVAEGRALVGPAPQIEGNGVILDAPGPMVRVWMWQGSAPEWAQGG